MCVAVVRYTVSLVLGVCLLLPVIALAASSVFLPLEAQPPAMVIENPEAKQSYFTELYGYPHTYIIDTDQNIELELVVEVPKTKEVKRNIGVIILRNLGDGKGVEEVARLFSHQASWEERRDIARGDTYLVGPTFSDTLEPGEYVVEVSTPVNFGKYVLRLGTESVEREGLMGKLKEMALIKMFFGKTQWAVFQSPYIFLPLVVLCIGGVSLFYYRRSRLID